MNGDPAKEFRSSATGIPASEDPGRNPDGSFRKGYSGNPFGKPRGRNFQTHLREALQRVGTNKAREVAAARVGCDPSDIPEDVVTFEDLMAWVAAMLAVAGNHEFWREFGDRVAPKPRRVEVSGPGGGPVRQTITQSDNPAEANAAQEYYDELDGELED